MTLWSCKFRGTSQVSIAAAYVVAVCEYLELPFVAYRFRVDEFGIPEPENSSLKVERSVEMNRLVLMTQSIIRQLVWILPDGIEPEKSIDLSFERFYDLDGSTESLVDMFDLVEELISLPLSQQLLIIVLDGIRIS